MPLAASLPCQPCGSPTSGPHTPQPGGTGPQLVVGTLDINQGAVLPAEQLVGRLPRQGDRRRRRAYISNVATWEGARRQGLARGSCCTKRYEKQRRRAWRTSMVRAGRRGAHAHACMHAGAWAHPAADSNVLAAPARRAVHVEASNGPAAALYLSSGFEVEAEESEGYARALNRNRRLLLHRQLEHT